MTCLLVAAAALVDPQGRVLMAQRPAGKSFAGLWEFPGGKVEPGETPEAALVRELAEELGITAAPAALVPVTFVSHPYPDFDLVMLLYLCRHWSGQPRGREDQALHWDDVAGLRALAMPPADVPLLVALAGIL